jgi:hypothetical protein
MRHSIEPAVARPAGDATEEGPGPLVGQRPVSSAQLAAVKAWRTWMGNRVSCAEVAAVRPSAGEGHISGN